MFHRTHADSVRFRRCQTEVNAVVRNTGAKYSVQFQLPYYDAVRFVIIDPVQLLFLGLAKTTLKVWKEKELIKDKHFDLLQRRVDAVISTARNWKDPFKDFHRIQWFYSRPVEELGLLLFSICIKGKFTSGTL